MQCTNHRQGYLSFWHGDGHSAPCREGRKWTFAHLRVLVFQRGVCRWDVLISTRDLAKTRKLSKTWLNCGDSWSVGVTRAIGTVTSTVATGWDYGYRLLCEELNCPSCFGNQPGCCFIHESIFLRHGAAFPKIVRPFSGFHTVTLGSLGARNDLSWEASALLEETSFQISTGQRGPTPEAGMWSEDVVPMRLDCGKA